MTATTERPTLYELSVPGRCAIDVADTDVPETDLPVDLLRDDNGLPELSQLDVVRHYLELSQANFGVDSGFYPLGSCTMKYNPKICDRVASLPGFADSHPLQSTESVQGGLAVMYDLQQWLAEIGGFSAVSLQPAAGAHGEFSALLMIRAYHTDRGEDQRRRQILIPDSAHGTNPASAAMAGYDILEIPTGDDGNVDLDALEAACDETVAGLMLTNPNTLGLFEQRIEQVARLVHGCGGLVYGDGANMNALTGIARPGDMGIDLMHYNLHKTFATPHGGGGPGSGPLGASKALQDYLPGPVIEKQGGTGEASIYATVTPEKSIGRMCTFFGNFGMMVRTWAYIRMHGAEGLRANAIHAVLNANYLRARMRDTYPVPFDRVNMHEFVCQGRPKGSAVRALDVCKRLLDHGFHPPTNYFPLIVPEALMIEPTETESKQMLDAFVASMLEIAAEAVSDPERLYTAPHQTPVGRLDETRAARDLIICDRQARPAPAGTPS